MITGPMDPDFFAYHRGEEKRVPIKIHPEVKSRLSNLLVFNQEMRGVGFSEFINRAIDQAYREMGKHE